MIYFECDRCNRPLAEGEGYQLNIQPRYVKLSIGMYVPNPQLDTSANYEVCEGCYNMLHFFFKQKFREDKPVAGS